MRKEAVVAYFKLLPRYLPGAEEHQIYSGQPISRPRLQPWIWTGETTFGICVRDKFHVAAEVQMHRMLLSVRDKFHVAAEVQMHRMLLNVRDKFHVAAEVQMHRMLLSVSAALRL
jgi:hypothetical protein